MERYEPKTVALSSAQLRKIKKPIIERRRRERINDSLNQLKTLLLDALHKDEAENSKMEKADILELAVNYLKNIKHSQHQTDASGAAEKLTSQYQAGYGACAREVGRYLNRNQFIDPTLASRVTGHVSSKLSDNSLHGPNLQTTVMASLPTGTPAIPSIPECSRLTSLSGHSVVVPLYVDTGLCVKSRGQYQSGNAPVVSTGRPCSLPRTPSPEPASEADTSAEQLDASCSMAHERDSPALPESPVWRPW